MAKYTVNFACGHEATITLFGKMKDRYSKIEYFERCGMCPKCYREMMEEKRNQERAEQRAKAIDTATKNNLPELTGTEKQINWALTIRDTFFNDALKVLNDYKIQVDEVGITEENKNILLADIEEVKKFFNDKTESKFWIEHRDEKLSDMLPNTITKQADKFATLRWFNTYFPRIRF